MDFPERIYTTEEHKKARELLNKGYKHDLKVLGSPGFQQKVNRALDLVKTAELYEFL